MDVEKRRKEILKKIVSEYINTGQPVGSEKIVEKFHFPISPATVRNDMAVLEKLGYINQPYTSAGRIPTSKGYRFFVEESLREKPQISSEKIRMPSPTKIKSMNDMLAEISELISQHTREISLVVSPSSDDTRIKYIHFFAISPSSVYLVLVSNTQTSEGFPLGSFNITKEELMRVENVINDSLKDLSFKKAMAKIKERNFFRDEIGENFRIVMSLYGYLKMECEKGATREIFIRGISNLLTTRISIAEQKVKYLLNILEEKKTLSELIDSIPSNDRLGFSIGEENKIPELWDYSLVSVKYTIKDMEGTLALLGPVRMDYVKGILVLERIAEKLEELSERIIE